MWVIRQRETVDIKDIEIDENDKFRNSVTMQDLRSFMEEQLWEGDDVAEVMLFGNGAKLLQGEMEEGEPKVFQIAVRMALPKEHSAFPKEPLLGVPAPHPATINKARARTLDSKGNRQKALTDTQYKKALKRHTEAIAYQNSMKDQVPKMMTIGETPILIYSMVSNDPSALGDFAKGMSASGTYQIHTFNEKMLKHLPSWGGSNKGGASFSPFADPENAPVKLPGNLFTTDGRLIDQQAFGENLRFVRTSHTFSEQDLTDIIANNVTYKAEFDEILQNTGKLDTLEGNPLVDNLANAKEQLAALQDNEVIISTREYTSYGTPMKETKMGVQIGDDLIETYTRKQNTYSGYSTISEKDNVKIAKQRVKEAQKEYEQGYPVAYKLDPKGRTYTDEEGNEVVYAVGKNGRLLRAVEQVDTLNEVIPFHHVNLKGEIDEDGPLEVPLYSNDELRKPIHERTPNVGPNGETLRHYQESVSDWRPLTDKGEHGPQEAIISTRVRTIGGFNRAADEIRERYQQIVDSLMELQGGERGANDQWLDLKAGSTGFEGIRVDILWENPDTGETVTVAHMLPDLSGEIDLETLHEVGVDALNSTTYRIYQATPDTQMTEQNVPILDDDGEPLLTDKGSVRTRKQILSNPRANFLRPSIILSEPEQALNPEELEEFVQAQLVSDALRANPYIQEALNEAEFSIAELNDAVDIEEGKLKRYIEGELEKLAADPSVGSEELQVAAQVALDQVRQTAEENIVKALASGDDSIFDEIAIDAIDPKDADNDPFLSPNENVSNVNGRRIRRRALNASRGGYEIPIEIAADVQGTVSGEIVHQLGIEEGQSVLNFDDSTSALQHVVNTVINTYDLSSARDVRLQRGMLARLRNLHPTVRQDFMRQYLTWIGKKQTHSTRDLDNMGLFGMGSITGLPIDQFGEVMVNRLLAVSEKASLTPELYIPNSMNQIGIPKTVEPEYDPLFRAFLNKMENQRQGGTEWTHEHLEGLLEATQNYVELVLEGDNSQITVNNINPRDTNHKPLFEPTFIGEWIEILNNQYREEGTGPFKSGTTLGTAMVELQSDFETHREANTTLESFVPKGKAFELFHTAYSILQPLDEKNRKDVSMDAKSDIPDSYWSGGKGSYTKGDRRVRGSDAQTDYYMAYPQLVAIAQSLYPDYEGSRPVFNMLRNEGLLPTTNLQGVEDDANFRNQLPPSVFKTLGDKLLNWNKQETVGLHVRNGKLYKESYGVNKSGFVRRNAKPLSGPDRGRVPSLEIPGWQALPELQEKLAEKFPELSTALGHILKYNGRLTSEQMGVIAHVMPILFGELKNKGEKAFTLTLDGVEIQAKGQRGRPMDKDGGVLSSLLDAIRDVDTAPLSQGHIEAKDIRVNVEEVQAEARIPRTWREYRDAIRMEIYRNTGGNRDNIRFNEFLEREADLYNELSKPGVLASYREEIEKLPSSAGVGRQFDKEGNRLERKILSDYELAELLVQNELIHWANDVLFEELKTGTARMTYPYNLIDYTLGSYRDSRTQTEREDGSIATSPHILGPDQSKNLRPDRAATDEVMFPDVETRGIFQIGPREDEDHLLMNPLLPRVGIASDQEVVTGQLPFTVQLDGAGNVHLVNEEGVIAHFVKRVEEATDIAQPTERGMKPPVRPSSRIQYDYYLPNDFLYTPADEFGPDVSGVYEEEPIGEYSIHKDENGEELEPLQTFNATMLAAVIGGRIILKKGRDNTVQVLDLQNESVTVQDSVVDTAKLTPQAYRDKFGCSQRWANAFAKRQLPIEEAQEFWEDLPGARHLTDNNFNVFEEWLKRNEEEIVDNNEDSRLQVRHDARMFIQLSKRLDTDSPWLHKLIFNEDNSWREDGLQALDTFMNNHNLEGFLNEREGETKAQMNKRLRDAMTKIQNLRHHYPGKPDSPEGSDELLANLINFFTEQEIELPENIGQIPANLRNREREIIQDNIESEEGPMKPWRISRGVLVRFNKQIEDLIGPEWIDREHELYLGREGKGFSEHYLLTDSNGDFRMDKFLGIAENENLSRDQKEALLIFFGAFADHVNETLGDDESNNIPIDQGGRLPENGEYHQLRSADFDMLMEDQDGMPSDLKKIITLFGEEYSKIPPLGEEKEVVEEEEDKDKSIEEWKDEVDAYQKWKGEVWPKDERDRELPATHQARLKAQELGLTTEQIQFLYDKVGGKLQKGDIPDDPETYDWSGVVETPVDDKTDEIEEDVVPSDGIPEEILARLAELIAEGRTRQEAKDIILAEQADKQPDADSLDAFVAKHNPDLVRIMRETHGGKGTPSERDKIWREGTTHEGSDAHIYYEYLSSLDEEALKEVYNARVITRIENRQNESAGSDESIPTLNETERLERIKDLRGFLHDIIIQSDKTHNPESEAGKDLVPSEDEMKNWSTEKIVDQWQKAQDTLEDRKHKAVVLAHQNQANDLEFFRTQLGDLAQRPNAMQAELFARQLMRHKRLYDTTDPLISREGQGRYITEPNLVAFFSTEPDSKTGADSIWTQMLSLTDKQGNPLIDIKALQDEELTLKNSDNKTHEIEQEFNESIDELQTLIRRDETIATEFKALLDEHRLNDFYHPDNLSNAIIDPLSGTVARLGPGGRTADEYDDYRTMVYNLSDVWQAPYILGLNSDEREIVQDLHTTLLALNGDPFVVRNHTRFKSLHQLIYDGYATDSPEYIAEAEAIERELNVQLEHSQEKLAGTNWEVLADEESWEQFGLGQILNISDRHWNGVPKNIDVADVALRPQVYDPYKKEYTDAKLMDGMWVNEAVVRRMMAQAAVSGGDVLLMNPNIANLSSIIQDVPDDLRAGSEKIFTPIDGVERPMLIGQHGGIYSLPSNAEAIDSSKGYTREEFTARAYVESLGDIMDNPELIESEHMIFVASPDADGRIMMRPWEEWQGGVIGYGKDKDVPEPEVPTEEGTAGAAARFLAEIRGQAEEVQETTTVPQQLYEMGIIPGLRTVMNWRDELVGRKDAHLDTMAYNMTLTQRAEQKKDQSQVNTFLHEKRPNEYDPEGKLWRERVEELEAPREKLTEQVKQKQISRRANEYVQEGMSPQEAATRALEDFATPETPVTQDVTDASDVSMVPSPIVDPDAIPKSPTEESNASTYNVQNLVKSKSAVKDLEAFVATMV